MTRWLSSILVLTVPLSLAACTAGDDEIFSGRQQGVEEEGEEGGAWPAA